MYLQLIALAIGNRIFLAILAFVLAPISVGATAGVQPSGYIVTAEPISVHPGPGGLCIAIDPADPAGVWWWGPGRLGCASRNTLPGPRQENATGIAALFHPTNAAVSTDASGTIHAWFRLGMQGQPEFIDVDLMVLAGLIRCTSTKAAVSAKRLAVLDIPFDGRDEGGFSRWFGIDRRDSAPPH